MLRALGKAPLWQRRHKKLFQRDVVKLLAFFLRFLSCGSVRTISFSAFSLEKYIVAASCYEMLVHDIQKFWLLLEYNSISMHLRKNNVSMDWVPQSMVENKERLGYKIRTEENFVDFLGRKLDWLLSLFGLHRNKNANVRSGPLTFIIFC